MLLHAIWNSSAFRSLVESQKGIITTLVGTRRALIYICKNHPSAFLTCANPRATRAQTEPNATEKLAAPTCLPLGTPPASTLAPSRSSSSRSRTLAEYKQFFVLL